MPMVCLFKLYAVLLYVVTTESYTGPLGFAAVRVAERATHILTVVQNMHHPSSSAGRQIQHALGEYINEALRSLSRQASR